LLSGDGLVGARHLLPPSCIGAPKLRIVNQHLAPRVHNDSRKLDPLRVRDEAVFRIRFHPDGLFPLPSPPIVIATHIDFGPPMTLGNMREQGVDSTVRGPISLGEGATDDTKSVSDDIRPIPKMTSVEGETWRRESMSPQEEKLAKYHRQWERENKMPLWFALAIVIVPVVGLGVFLSFAN
jgi:hypothetical protein